MLYGDRGRGDREEAGASVPGRDYTFGIDRGGTRGAGRSQGAEHVRFDSVVVVPIRTTRSQPPSSALTDPHVQSAAATSVSLPSSSVSIQGTTITMTVPLSKLPSAGHAIDQWNVNFFTANPRQKPGFRRVASLTPEFADFQVFVKPPPKQ